MSQQQASSIRPRLAHHDSGPPVLACSRTRPLFHLLPVLATVHAPATRVPAQSPSATSSTIHHAAPPAGARSPGLSAFTRPACRALDGGEGLSSCASVASCSCSRHTRSFDGFCAQRSHGHGHSSVPRPLCLGRRTSGGFGNGRYGQDITQAGDQVRPHIISTTYLVCAQRTVLSTVSAEVGFTVPPRNPALPHDVPPAVAGNGVQHTVGTGVQRIYPEVRHKPLEFGHPPRPIPGSIADLDRILEHCDYDTGKVIATSIAFFTATHPHFAVHP